MRLQYEGSDALTVSPRNWYDTYNICHRQATVSRHFQIGFCILTPVQLVPLRTYCLKRLS
jgi:hypothetical protein